MVEVGYLGELSIYKLRIGSDMSIKAAIANTGRRSERAFAVNARVWACFAPASAIVLTR